MLSPHAWEKTVKSHSHMNNYSCRLGDLSNKLVV